MIVAILASYPGHVGGALFLLLGGLGLKLHCALIVHSEMGLKKANEGGGWIPSECYPLCYIVMLSVIVRPKQLGR